jgi:PII-like signaling protein
MDLTGECQIVRIYVGETERVEGRPLYEVIVEKAENSGAAGVTVIRGIEGFGAAKHVHKTRPLQYSDDLPVVIEIVDKEEKINEIISMVEPMVLRGLILRDTVHVVAYRHDH